MVSRPALRIAVSFLAVQFASATMAQTIDPSILRSLQSQMGAGNAGAGQTLQNRSGTNASQQTNSQDSPTAVTPEERQLRRVQAERKLAELYLPSAVERDYRTRLGDTTLRQFGYDLFQGGAAPTGVRTGAIGNDYVLGIGDEIQISFRGATNSTQQITVDRDGMITAGQLRPIRAAGRTLGTVKAELDAETRRSLLATDVYVSVGDVRSISVFVGGEVERPGQLNLTSLSDIATALAQAGGVRKTGSLRQVRLVRANGSVQTVDLYGMLGIGTLPRIRLQDGDRVIVPVIGPTIAVTGAVPRPGVYELRGTASISAVVAYAGGALRQRGAQVVISRIAADGSESFIRAAGGSEKVVGGDAIQLVGSSPGGAIGRVELLGNVDNPGSRPLVSARTVAELVGRPEDLRSDTYQPAAVLQRRDAATGSRVFQTINLAQELRDGSSTQLMSEDKLYIFSRNDIDFMNGVPVRQIILGQRNPRPECKSLVTLEQLARDTQTARFSAVTRGSFVVETRTGSQIGTTGRVLRSGSADKEAALGLSLDSQDGLLEPLPDDRDPQSATSANSTDTSRKYDRFGRKRPTTDEEWQAYRDERCPSIFEDRPELLGVLLENSVSIGGAVRRPGAYPIGGIMTARDMALIAEGLMPATSGLSLDVQRIADDRPETVQVDAAGTALASTVISPGDDIRFNASQPIYENSGVLVSGEVARPGLYTIRRGEKLSELLERAGGLTRFAYPYGTVFTRKSVKLSQEEGFKRTARELNNSLLAIAARSTNSNGSGLAGAASLIESMSNIEATGRMVVEADPRVLQVRPDLDTVLEAGDAINVPKRPNFVLALGDLNNPGALQFVERKTAMQYMSEAGGPLSTADKKRAFMVLPNGAAQPISTTSWADSRMTPPPPGTAIIVPKNIDPLYKLSVFRDVATIIGQMATSVATVAVLATN